MHSCTCHGAGCSAQLLMRKQQAARASSHSQAVEADAGCSLCLLLLSAGVEHLHSSGLQWWCMSEQDFAIWTRACYTAFVTTLT